MENEGRSTRYVIVLSGRWARGGRYGRGISFARGKSVGLDGLSVEMYASLEVRDIWRLDGVYQRKPARRTRVTLCL